MKKAFIIIVTLSIIVSIHSVIHKIGEYQNQSLSMYDVCIDNGKAYVAVSSLSNYYFNILDISDPYNPSLLGSATSSVGLNNVVIYGNRAYFTAGTNGIQIWDISNSQQPVFLSALSITGSCSKIKIADNNMYLANLENGLQIYDIENPTPIYLGGYTNCNAYDVEVKDSIAYVADRDFGLRIINISNPGNCSLLSSFSNNLAQSLAISDNLLFLTDNFHHNNIIDISNPLNPNQLSSITEMWVDEIAFHNTNLFLSISSPGTGMNKIQLYDITNASAPALSSCYAVSGEVNSMALTDNLLCFPDSYYGFTVLDISDLSDELLIANSPIPTEAEVVAKQGNYAYVADNDERLLQIDVSDPTQPRLQSELPFPYDVCAIQTDSNRAYVSAKESGLFIFDITEQSTPDSINFQLLSTFETGGYALNFCVMDRVLFLANETSMQIINVSDPYQPTLISQYQNEDFGALIHIAKHQNYIYVTGWSDPICIIDVSDLNNPQLAATVNHTYTASGLKIFNGYAYVGTFGSAIRVYSLSNPTSPVQVNTIMPRPGCTLGRFYIWSNYLFVTVENWNEIVCYNISNPLQPVIVRDYKWNLATNDLICSDGTLYTSNYTNGFSILNFNLPVENEDEYIPSPGYSLINYPNPFHSETTFKYDVQTKGSVELSIFNLRGQVIRHLLLEYRNAGSHTIKWDGRTDNHQKAASGVYLSRISVNGKQELRKIVLLK